MPDILLLCCFKVTVSLENIHWQKPALSTLKMLATQDVGNCVTCKL